MSVAKQTSRVRTVAVNAVRGLVVPPDGTPGMLAARAAINALGTGAYVAGSAVFFTRYVGLSVGQVGVGMSLGAAIGFLANVPLGRLADRVGARLSWRIGVAVQAALFLCYPMIDSVGVFFGMVCAVALAESFGSNGRAKYFGEALPDGSRVRVMGFLKVITNVGLAVGTGMAGIALGADTRLGYLILIYCNAATFAAEWVLLSVFGSDADRNGGREKNPRHKRAALRDVRLLALTAINGVLVLNDPLLLVVLPLWIVNQTDAPHTAIALTLGVNMVLTILVQRMVSNGVEGVRGASRAQLRAGQALCLSAVVFAFSGVSSGIITPALLVVGVAVFTMGEAHTSVGAWGIGYAYAPAEQRAEYLAVYYLGWKLSWIVGPAALTWLLTTFDQAGWVVVAALFLGAGLVAQPATEWAMRAREPAGVEREPAREHQ